MEKCQILLTNDDGIESPGLWAAAERLSELGFVTVAAPLKQSSGMSRSLPSTSDGRIHTRTVHVCGREWTVHAVGGSPAQAVLHGILEIMPRHPDLVVSGINYGENLGTGVTISGTIGAAMEAAALGIPALAMSLETGKEHQLSYSKEVDFSAAAHFAALFAGRLLEKRFPEDMAVLKVDVPSSATPETPWQLTRVARQPYYIPILHPRRSWTEPGLVDYEPRPLLDESYRGTDVYAMRVDHAVSVTPLSLDLTSRVEMGDLERLLQ